MKKKTPTEKDINHAIDQLLTRQQAPVCRYSDEDDIFTLYDKCENYAKRATCFLIMKMLYDELKKNWQEYNLYKINFILLIDSALVKSYGFHKPNVKNIKRALAGLKECMDNPVYDDTTPKRFRLECLIYWFLKSSEYALPSISSNFTYNSIAKLHGLDAQKIIIDIQSLHDQFITHRMHGLQTNNIGTSSDDNNDPSLSSSVNTTPVAPNNSSTSATTPEKNNPDLKEMTLTNQTEHHPALSPPHSNEYDAGLFVLFIFLVMAKVSPDGEIRIVDIMLLIASIVGLACTINSNTPEKNHVLQSTLSGSTDTITAPHVVTNSLNTNIDRPLQDIPTKLDQSNTTPLAPSEPTATTSGPHAEKEALKDSLVQILKLIKTKDKNKKIVLDKLSDKIGDTQFNWPNPADIHRFSAYITLARRVVAHVEYGKSKKTMPPEIKVIEKSFNDLFPELRFKVPPRLNNTNTSNFHSTTIFGSRKESEVITFKILSKESHEVFSAIDAINDTFDGTLSLEGFNDTSSEEEGRTTEEDLTTSEDISDDRDTPSPTQQYSLTMIS